MLGFKVEVCVSGVGYFFPTYVMFPDRGNCPCRTLLNSLYPSIHTTAVAVGTYLGR